MNLSPEQLRILDLIDNKQAREVMRKLFERASTTRFKEFDR